MVQSRTASYAKHILFICMTNILYLNGRSHSKPSSRIRRGKQFERVGTSPSPRTPAQRLRTYDHLFFRQVGGFTRQKPHPGAQ